MLTQRTRLILCLLGSALLSSCGNGQKGSIQPNTGSSAVHQSDEMRRESMELADSSYEGIRSRSSLTRLSAADFLNTIAFGAFPNKELVRPNDSFNKWSGLPWESLVNIPFIAKFHLSNRLALRNLTIDCQFGGTVSLESAFVDEQGLPTNVTVPAKFTTLYGNFDETVNYHYKVNFSHCKNAALASTYNGNVEFFYTTHFANQVTLDFKNMEYFFNDFTISTGEKAVLFNGSLNWPAPNSCTDEGLITFNMHAKLEAGMQSLLTKNFAIGWAGLSEHTCDSKFGNSNARWGQLYLSEFGLVDVSSSNLFDSKNMYHTESIPSFSVTAHNSTMAVQVRDIQNNRHVPEYSVSVETILSNETEPLTIEMHATDVSKGGLSDLRDDNNDGFSNGWEKLKGETGE